MLNNYKKDYQVVSLEKSIIELKEMLLREHTKYTKISKEKSWSGEDFAELYYSNLALLAMLEKQAKMIENIYDILARHEGGLG